MYKSTVVLDAAAEGDLERILIDSIDTFGDVLTADLAQRFDEAFGTLSEFPQSCRARALPDGRNYRVRVVNPFLIAYTEQSEGVRVFAIFHGAMDADSVVAKRI